MKEKTAKKKIILNYLPPSVSTFPSAALSILKSFMKKNGYEVKVIYWNVLLTELISFHLSNFFPYKGERNDFEYVYLIPFLSMISDKFKDNRSNSRIFTYSKRIFPKIQLDTNSWSETFKELKNEIVKLIETNLKKLDLNQVILFGFSSKFYQWVTAVIFAEKFKELFPNIKIVIGGFGDKAAACEALNTNKFVDFSIWGEGEYPLLELSDLLAEGNSDFSSIPGLVYRNKNNIRYGEKHSKLLDVQNYIYPDFDDFIQLIKKGEVDKDMVSLTIESERGCHWNRCKFCSGNIGYKYRKRSPESIAGEIDMLVTNYGITRFRFVGNDLVGRDIQQFETLLDRIITLSNRHEEKFDIFAEIIHSDFNSKIIKKMSIAGLNNVQIGYEAISDELLKKMDKKTDFADHILFLKFASKYGITIGGPNIIRGIIGETEDDVIESINNLIFLRFFINKNPKKFSHNISRLKIESGSKFSNMLKKDERKKWNINLFKYLLPVPFIEEDRRFALFDFTSQLENHVVWEWFDNFNKFYEETFFDYTIMDNDSIYYYIEFMDGKQTENIAFDEPEYIEILKIADEQVVSFNIILKKIRDKFPNMNRERLIDIISDLKSSYLLYSNKDFSRIISIINIDQKS